MTNASNEMDDKETLNIQEVLKPYLRKWPWFILAAIVSVGLANLYLRFKNPVYNIASTVLIKDAKSTNQGGDLGILQGLSALGGMGTNSVVNELEIFRSKKLMRNVVADQKLQMATYLKVGLRNVELYSTSNPIITKVIDEKSIEDFPKDNLDFKFTKSGYEISSPELDETVAGVFGKPLNLPFATIMITKNPKFIADKDLDYSQLSLSIMPFENTVSWYQEALNVDIIDDETTVNIVDGLP